MLQILNYKCEFKFKVAEFSSELSESFPHFIHFTTYSNTGAWLFFVSDIFRIS